METFSLNYPVSGKLIDGKRIVCGVVGSGNLEVIIEKNSEESTQFDIQTSVAHFQETWKKVIDVFVNECKPYQLKITIHDNGAMPPVVALRLRQALELFAGYQIVGKNYLELEARERIVSLVDENSFNEWLNNNDYCSPYLSLLNLPPESDDGIVIGSAMLNNKKVLIAAQQKDFMGGSVGEVHGAKLNGLFKAAIQLKVDAVILLIDSGGVRLHEPNAGEIAISEIIRSIFDARHAGIQTIGVVCGKNGAYGGMGIVSGCLDYLIGNEITRIGVSGAEVIQVVKGIEAFDAEDRQLIWRVYGGKTRYLQNIIQCYTDFEIKHIKQAVIEAMPKKRQCDLNGLLAEQAMLQQRFDQTKDFDEEKSYLGSMFSEDESQIAEMSRETFLAFAAKVKDR